MKTRNIVLIVCTIYEDLRMSLESEAMLVNAPGGYSDIFIRRLGSFFWFKNLNFNIFGVFRKNNIFWGMAILSIRGAFNM